jgi:precorrin-3B C17-methyltransferase
VNGGSVLNKIIVAGIGPGSFEQMTAAALKALEEADVIIGYTVYADLVRKHFPDKVFITTPMRKEVERCEEAFVQAEAGKTTVLICSGDAGVYGLAGLIFEIGEKHPGTQIEVLPGVTAALSGAALLGAPLIHDFCLISLSDLLTPWEKIAARLHAAAEADFVIVLYNPGSRGRKDHLSKACDILLRYRSPETVCGVTVSIGREGESSRILSLAELKDYQADMFTTVFIGNSQTREAGGKMVTPRGYLYE